MLPKADIYLSLELLLKFIFNQYLNLSPCITVVSEVSLDLNFLGLYSYIAPNDYENLTEQMLFISEQGCSDYIVLMNEPEYFMKAFGNVKHLGNMRRSDKKIVFLPYLESNYSNNNLLNLLSMSETREVANILLVLKSVNQALGCDNFTLVTHKFVGEDSKTHEPMVLDYWNSCKKQFEIGVNLFPHNMKDMFGKSLKIACFTYKPYILLDLDTKLAPSGRDGIEIRIVEEFCRWINCTIEIVRVEENLWGELYDNLTGTGILGSIIEGHADLGITALYSWYDVYKVLDFTAPWIKTSITCVAPAAKLLVSWELPLLPFSLLMWLALLFTFFYSSFALALAQRSFVRMGVSIK